MKTDATTAPALFRALADMTRLRILNLLLEGELCVCDLCTILDEIQPKVSRHLACLRRVGLVTVRTDGKWKHYAVEGDRPGLRRALLDCVRPCRREMSELRSDLRRLRTLDCGAGCR